MAILDGHQMLRSGVERDRPSSAPMGARVRVALAFLRAERRTLESRIGAAFDPVLSRRLDGLTVAIEALDVPTRQERAA